ncbi:hypothetical protein PIB30_005881 [Stylosanthes scabra]|uniref:Uncharacterized protein n=1 Tax=Stylosanthes scabra TaxID=79078 RepID=A0ABU6Q446_9FABA|nr:hypothetical protein [Stylosanthes scabra]
MEWPPSIVLVAAVLEQRRKKRERDRDRERKREGMQWWWLFTVATFKLSVTAAVGKGTSAGKHVFDFRFFLISPVLALISCQFCCCPFSFNHRRNPLTSPELIEQPPLSPELVAATTGVLRGRRSCSNCPLNLNHALIMILERFHFLGSVQV